ncbi:hypothetical protein [Alkaliflexus imshenetskii]|uniref:hypothetical protein n=1 Tax=Alkaliflexus imshenetskii TaxID=286730 RepID=UPI00047D7378|nr:hypothetical protein [Alkaliflexus imshenetskii]
MKKFNLLILLGVFIFVGCSDNELDNNFNHENPDFEEVVDTEKHLVEFAKVLSKAVHERKDVREFLKNEALKQFDCNYNVLYYLVSDELIGDESFRDILISYSSEEVIDQVERNVPLLNILIPELHFFEVFPEELDIEDDETPVAVIRELVNTLYFNGDAEIDLKKDIIPDFHVFVVNQNKHVKIPKQDLKSGGVKSIEFKSPNFDGRNVSNGNPILKSSTNRVDVLGSRAIDSWNHFYANDGSIRQKAFQRDFIYYGLTPNNRTGNFDHSISEYICYFEVPPSTYQRFVDSTDPDHRNGDGWRTETSPETDLDVIYDKIWGQNYFVFRFDVIKSNESNKLPLYASIKPKDLWDFEYRTWKARNASWRKRAHYAHAVDVESMKAKKIYLKDLDKEGNMGPWNLANEGSIRTIHLYEEDVDVKVSLTYEYTTVRSHNGTVSGNRKTDIGVSKTEISAAFNHTNSRTEKTSVTRSWNEGDDYLGRFDFYFYTPVINSKSANNYEIYTVSYDGIKIGITVK